MKHLTDQQLARSFKGQLSDAEQSHLSQCAACSNESRQFAESLGLFREALTIESTAGKTRAVATFAAEEASAQQTASGFLSSWRGSSLGSNDVWGEGRSRSFGMLSLAFHVAIVGVLVLSPVKPDVAALKATTVFLLDRLDSISLRAPAPKTERSGGGGGGGRKAVTPPSKGVPPRSAEVQLLPPLVEVKNLAPSLVVEPTIVAPPTMTQRFLLAPIGDPNGVVGPPSPGPGKGGGIGTGEGTGVGEGRGDGLALGFNSGRGGGVYSVGGGVSEPVLVRQVTPEYSDDGRKGRIQGVVELYIIVAEDGSVRFQRVAQSLGYGLDQKAIEAVRQWRFIPGKLDGRAVPVIVSVQVSFSLR